MCGDSTTSWAGRLDLADGVFIRQMALPGDDSETGRELAAGAVTPFCT